MKGTVKWFSPEKGFGFITDEGGNDIFVYYSDIIADGFKTLSRGQAVEFEISDGEDGTRAKKVIGYGIA